MLLICTLFLLSSHRFSAALPGSPDGVTAETGGDSLVRGSQGGTVWRSPGEPRPTGSKIRTSVSPAIPYVSQGPDAREYLDG